MKNFVAVCLGVLAVVFAALPAYPKQTAEEVSPFTLAKRIGDPRARCFHLFSTSIANYTITHNGMGEGFIAGRRKLFHVKVGARARIDRLYFFEYEGDLLLLYETDDSGYLARLDQKTRKLRWTKSIASGFAPPVVKDGSLVFTDGVVISLSGT